MTFNFKRKTSSILDFRQDELDPSIWKDNTLLPEVRDFIYNKTIQFFERREIFRYQGFIQDCYIASSLASYSYKDDTDLDIKFVIDIPSFIKYNPAFKEKTGEEITDYLIDIARESSELTAFIPNTEHELDPYFYDELEGVEDNLIKYDSLYSLGGNRWIKQPTKLPVSIPPEYFLNKAKQYAEPYLEKVTKDIEKTKRDSIDFMLLKDYLRQLDDVSDQEVYFYFSEQLKQIDADLDMLEEDRALIKQLRAENFSKTALKTEIENLGGSLNYGKGNLIFKLFQRYGYMKILNELKQIREDRDFTIDDLPVLMSIINN